MDSPQGAVVVVTAGQPAERGEVEQHVELVVVLEGSEREGTHTHTGEGTHRQSPRGGGQGRAVVRRKALL